MDALLEAVCERSPAGSQPTIKGTTDDTGNSTDLQTDDSASSEEGGPLVVDPLVAPMNKDGTTSPDDVICQPATNGAPGMLPRPCAGCRIARVKCSRTVPCTRCARLGLQCRLAPALRRGRPSKHARVIKMLAQAKAHVEAEAHNMRMAAELAERQLAMQAATQAAMQGQGVTGTAQDGSVVSYHMMAAPMKPPVMAAMGVPAAPMGMRVAMHQNAHQVPPQAVPQPFGQPQMAQAQPQPFGHVQTAPVAQAQIMQQPTASIPVSAPVQAATNGHLQLKQRPGMATPQTMNYMTLVPIGRLQQLLQTEAQAAHSESMLRVLRKQLAQQGVHLAVA